MKLIDRIKAFFSGISTFLNTNEIDEYEGAAPEVATKELLKEAVKKGLVGNDEARNIANSFVANGKMAKAFDARQIEDIVLDSDDPGHKSSVPKVKTTVPSGGQSKPVIKESSKDDREMEL